MEGQRSSLCKRGRKEVPVGLKGRRVYYHCRRKHAAVMERTVIVVTVTTVQ
jgi:hypothetical protein